MGLNNNLPILLARVMSNRVVTDAFLVVFVRCDGESVVLSRAKVDSRSSRENWVSEGTSFHTDVASAVDCNLFQKKGRSRFTGSALRDFSKGGGGGSTEPLPNIGKGGGGGGGGEEGCEKVGVSGSNGDCDPRGGGGGKGAS